MVVEVNERTKSKLIPTISVVTNIDLEHLDFHKSEKNLENAFVNFISSIPFYGFCVICIDHPRIQKIFSKFTNRKIITYGISPKADIRAVNIKYSNEKMIFDVIYKGRKKDTSLLIKNVEFSMIGLHNVQNALASIAIALELDIKKKIIKSALRSFKGVQRRFQLIDVYNKIKIIDDYGHHPEEIKLTLSATKLLNTNGKVLAIFQPHRYSRLKNHFESFVNVLMMLMR